MLAHNPRILYVDDDPDSCQVIGLMLYLDDERYAITAVSSAAEALALIEKQAFDLFILDYVLPEMSGADLCREIRRTDTRTPVMFYSGMAREIDRQAALAAGADEYLVNPNDLDLLCLTVKSLLDESRMRREQLSDNSKF